MLKSDLIGILIVKSLLNSIQIQNLLRALRSKAHTYAYVREAFRPPFNPIPGKIYKKPVLKWLAKPAF